jgi:hypothetical protein
MQGRWQGGQQKAHEDDSAAIENENYFKCSPPAMADSSGVNQIQVSKIEEKRLTIKHVKMPDLRL